MLDLCGKALKRSARLVAWERLQVADGGPAGNAVGEDIGESVELELELSSVETADLDCSGHADAVSHRTSTVPHRGSR